MKQEPMGFKDALELVKLCMVEDNMGWATAVKEYASLTNISTPAALRDIGKHLKDFKATLIKE